MERVKGEKYWSIVQTMHGFEVCDFVDDFDEWDNADFEIGNRFPDRESAEAMAEKFRAVLKGAEVIEMPSEEELVEKATDYAKTIYLEDALGGWEDGKGAFIDGATFMATKIVK